MFSPWKAGRSRLALAAVIAAAVPLFAACSLKSVSLSATKPMLADIVASYRAESDVEIVRAAAPGHLKMLDGLIRGNPEDPELLSTGCQLYAFYAFGLIEDEMESAAEGPSRDAVKARLKLFYARSREYGLRRLSLWKGGPDRPPSQSFPNPAEVELYGKTYGTKDVPALFWTALSWMSLIQLSLDEPHVAAALPVAASLAEHALRLDGNYFHGGPHLLTGVYFGSRSKALGGDPDKAAKEFDEADRIAGGKFLLVPLLKARFWAVTAQDRPTCESLLRRVAANDPSILPEDYLSNVLARRRANRYLQKLDDWF